MSTVRTNMVVTTQDRSSAAFRRMSLESASARKSIMALDAKVGMLTRTLGALSAGVAVGFGIGELVTEIFQAGVQSQRLDRAFLAITGSAAAAREEMAWLKEEADRLKVNFWTLADGYKGFLAAAKDTSLTQGQIHKIYTSVTEAGVALGMSNDDLQGSLRAITQMLSKGKVQAEELRGQLGERLPGAFQLAARAMGVTTAELNKMLETGKVIADDMLPKLADVLHRDFGDDAASATGDAARAVDKLAESWTNLKVTIAENGFLDVAASILDWMSEKAENTATNIKLLTGSLSNKDKVKIYTEGIEQAEAELKQMENELSKLQSQKLTNVFEDKDIRVLQKNIENLKETISEASRLIRLYQTMDNPTKDLWQFKEGLSGTSVHEQKMLNPGTASIDKIMDEWLKKRAGMQKRINKLSMDSHQFALYMIDEEVKALTAGGASAVQVEEYKRAAILDINRRARAEEERERKVSAAKLRQDQEKQYRERKSFKIAQMRQRLTPEDFEIYQLEDRAEQFKSQGRDELEVEEWLTTEISRIRNRGIDRDASYRLARVTDFQRQYQQMLLGETDFAIRQIEAQGQAWIDAGADRVQVEQLVADQVAAVRKEAADKQRTALEQYAESAADTSKGWSDAAINSVKSFENTLVDALSRGKLEFRDFAQSIIADLMRIYVRSQITGPLSGWLNTLMNGGQPAAAPSGSAGLSPYGPPQMGGAGFSAPPSLPTGSSPSFGQQPQNVKVVVENRSGTPVEASGVTTHLDSGEMLVNVMLDKMQKNPRLRKQVKGMLK